MFDLAQLFNSAPSINLSIKTPKSDLTIDLNKKSPTTTTLPSNYIKSNSIKSNLIKEPQTDSQRTSQVPLTLTVIYSY